MGLTHKPYTIRYMYSQQWDNGYRLYMYTGLGTLHVYRVRDFTCIPG